MRSIVLNILAEVNFFLYRAGFLKNKIKVYSLEETLNELVRTQKSLIRFGDGEIEIMRGKSLKLQSVDARLGDELKNIIGYENDNLMIALPDIFSDLSRYKKESQLFWKRHLLVDRRIYNSYCNPEKKYYNAFCSRFYYAFRQREMCPKLVSQLKQIWENKDVVIVEGERTHNGVGNDLFEKTKTIERIIGPACNAYERLDDIEQCCMEYPKDRLFLLSLGVAAKVLADRLFRAGYRVIDIGNVDLEYEWFLNSAQEKQSLYKHRVISIEENINAGYMEYLRQIRQRIL